MKVEKDVTAFAACLFQLRYKAIAAVAALYAYMQIAYRHSAATVATPAAVGPAVAVATAVASEAITDAGPHSNLFSGSLGSVSIIKHLLRASYVLAPEHRRTL
jgi:hypothetical protein